MTTFKDFCYDIFIENEKDRIANETLEFEDWRDEISHLQIFEFWLDYTRGQNEYTIGKELYKLL